MSLSMFALATSVMIAALAVVVGAAYGTARLASTVRSRLAVAGLLGYGIVLVLRPPGWALIDTAVLAGAAGGAVLLAHRLSSPASILVFLAVAAVADLVSTSVGPTAAVVDQYRQEQSDLLLYLTVVIPLEGRTVPIVGVADLFVGGAAAGALLRQDFRAGPVFGAVALGLVLALGFALWRGGIAAIPWMTATVALLVWWGPIRRSKTGSEEGLAYDE